MRYFALVAAGILMVAAGSDAQAFPPSGMSRPDSLIVRVQDRQQPESTLKRRIKRAWKDLTGYRFDVACPGFWLAINQSVCTETGKSREDARVKCEYKHPLCQVRDAEGSASRRRSSVLNWPTMAAR